MPSLQTTRFPNRYLQGAEFKNVLELVIKKTIEMHDDLKKEMKDHFKSWKKRHDSLESVREHTTRVQTKTADLIAGKTDIAQEIVIKKPFPALPRFTETELRE